jgi:hypothetical protein
MRKSIGETLFEAWMPLHPAPSSIKATHATKRIVFRFAVTELSV